MSGRVPEHIIQQIVRSTNLASLIGRHCDLKPKGGSYWGRCPFHKEKTPSFKVDPDKGVYYCFGCHEGGNVFTWLDKVEGLDFREALERLAHDAGVDLSAYRHAGGPEKGELQRLRETCELAAAYYAKCLAKRSEATEHVQAYLERRRISAESVEHWRLGYAPDGWDHFLRFSLGRGCEEETLRSAGLIKPREGAGGHYDVFRNRLIFPVCDRSGRVIGFGARALSDEDEPKYLNSPEGPLFHKGSSFYGLAQAREAIRSERSAVVVEGYTDVIMAHQHGVENAVAVLGTALTAEHAQVLGRLCERVILVFDADAAGQQSAARSIEVLLAEDMDVRVAGLEEGLDPCDFLLRRGAEEFRRKLSESEDFWDFRVRRAAQGRGAGTFDRSAAFKELAELALAVPNEGRRDMIIRRLAHELGVGERSAWAYIERALAGRRRPAEAAAPARAEQAARMPRTAGQWMAFEMVGLLLEESELQKRACTEVDLGLLEPCAETQVLQMLLKASGSGPAVQGRDFISAIDEPGLARMAVEALVAEEKKRALPGALGPGERYAAYLASLNRKSRRQEIAEELISAAGPAPAAAETREQHGAPGQVAAEDERLRRYDELRRREDKDAARINPRKASQ